MPVCRLSLFVPKEKELSIYVALVLVRAVMIRIGSVNRLQIQNLDNCTDCVRFLCASDPEHNGV